MTRHGCTTTIIATCLFLLPCAAEREGLEPVDASSLEDAAQKGDPETIERAVQALVDSIEHASRVERRAVVSRLMTAAETMFDSGRNEGTERCVSAALDVLRQDVGPRDRELGDPLSLLGDALYWQGRFQDAASALEEAREILGRRQRGHEELYGRILNSLGEVHRAQGRYDDANDFFKSAEGLAEKIHDDELLVSVLNNRAGIDRDFRRFADAELRLQRSLAIRLGAPAPDDANIALGQFNLAEIYRMQRQFAAAEPLYIAALETAERMKDPRLAYYVSQLAELRADQGHYDEAESRYQQALALRASAPDFERAQTLHAFGMLLHRIGRLDRAEAMLREAQLVLTKARGADHPDTAATTVELAHVLLDAGGARSREAANLAAAGAAVLDRSPANPDARVKALYLGARLQHIDGKPLAAFQQLEAAIDAAETLRPLAGGGVATRASYNSQWLDLYQQMIDWRAASEPEIAFRYAERARARVLLDDLAAHGIDLEADIPASVLAPLRRKRRVLADEAAQLRERISRGEMHDTTAAMAQLDDIERQLVELMERIRNESPAWRGAAGTPVSTGPVGDAAIPRDGFSIVYHVGPRKSWLFQLRGSPAPVRAFELGVDGTRSLPWTVGEMPLVAADVDRLMLDHTEGLVSALGMRGRPARGVKTLESESLHGERLIERLHLAWKILIPSAVQEDLLNPAVRTIVIVPDGALRQFPFEALVLDPTGRSGPIYWLDRGPVIAYGDSISALARLATRASTRPLRTASVVTVGGVEFSRDPVRAPARPSGSASRQISSTMRAANRLELTRLPGSLEESVEVEHAIETADSRARVTALRGSRATEARLREAMPRASILHLATHGILDTGSSGWFASLALAPPMRVAKASDDGFLQLHEIYGLRLNTQLAVLSACNTQVGTRVEGEGVLALTRGFFAAGADRVIATLWQVDDDATAKTVASLFTHALGAQSGSAPEWATALREAKREIRNRPGWEQPYFWAAFTFNGPADVLPQKPTR